MISVHKDSMSSFYDKQTDKQLNAR